MAKNDPKDVRLGAVAVQNAHSVLAARQRAEEDLLRAKDELQVRESQLSLIYSSVSDGIFYAAVESDGGLRVESANRAFLNALNLQEAMVIGRLLHELIPESSAGLFLENCARVNREHKALRWEQSIGDRRSGEMTITPLFDGEGRCTHLIGAIHDVTERRQAEELRNRLAAVVESSDDAVLTKTLEGIICTWNKGASRMFGYSAEEVIGKPVTILIPPERNDEEPGILSRLARGERIEHYETERVRKDGSRLDISLTVSPIVDADGRIIGVSKIARDITVRKRAEEALREESRMLELLNKTGAAIASQLDLQSVLQAVTDWTTRLSGAQFGALFYNSRDETGDAFTLYTLAGVSRDSFEKLGDPRTTPMFSPTFLGLGVVRYDDVLQSPLFGKMAPDQEASPGHLRVRSYLAVPVCSRSGEVIGGLFFGHEKTGVFKERTESMILGVAAQAAIAIDNARLYEAAKRSAQDREQLLEAERSARAEAERVSLQKDEFLATLSHELRTPLNAILGWAQIVKRSATTDPAAVEEGLSIIERNARVQTQLIEDLLDMSRIISGKVHLDVQQVELQDVIKAAVASVRHSADAKEIRLQLVLDPLARPVRGDPNRLQQCFWNLLSNAIKFTPKGGRIRVELERVNGHLEATVSDNGQGISPEFLPYVFERFRQADASITRHHGGLGLGLSIVKHLVELHGGTVRAKSAGVGLGSTFCIDLPVMVVHSTGAQPTREYPHAGSLAAYGADTFDHPSLTGITVLIVDDEPDARHLVKRVLEECGARVIVAATAAEGFDAVRRELPDMIVSDIGMPGEDGYAFIRRVRALPIEEGSRTPAAAFTAFARAEDRTRALRAGYQAHIAKPVDATELTAVVASLATRH